MQVRSRFVGVLVVAGALAAGVLACGGDDKPQATATRPAVIATAPSGAQGGAGGTTGAQGTAPAGGVAGTQPAGGTAGGSSNLGAANQAFNQAGDYTMTLASQTAAGRFEATVQVKPPNAYRATINVGQGVPAQEIIGIGNQTYLKTGNTWQAVPGASLPFGPQQYIGQINTILSGQATRSGSKTIAGANCDVYETRTPTGGTNSVCINSRNLPLEVVTREGSLSTSLTFVYGPVPAITAP